MKKVLAIGIIVLFIGMSVPSTGTIVEKKFNILTFNDGSLLGYINDSSMNPIAGALVRVYFHETYEEDFTDSSGYYHVTNIPICNCTKNCTAFKSRYKPAWVLLGIGKNTTYDFVLTPGNKLYVGGTVNNYSRIQDAINAANDGDTVFVYDDSSPYYEHVKVDKSINLIGEDKNTTIIDGSEWIDVVSVSADFVSINGFTIQNSGYYTRYDSGIKIQSNYCSISDNFLENNFNGIFLYSSYNIRIFNNNFYNNDYGALYFEQSDNNIVTDNFILNYYGITLEDSSNNTISENKIISEINPSFYSDGISCSNSINNIKRNTLLNTYLSRMQLIDLNRLESYYEPAPYPFWSFGGSNNTISGNYLSSHGSCIWAVNTSNYIISENTIVYYAYGIVHIGNYNDRILRNNFFKNHSDVLGRYALCFDFDLSDDLWDGNYFNRPRLLPKPILGFILIKLTKNRSIPFPWINFDWHPAKEPYDIEV